jgi:hypothetical protein
LIDGRFVVHDADDLALLFLARHFLTLRQLAHGRTHIQSVTQRLVPGRSAKSSAVACFQVSFANPPFNF